MRLAKTIAALGVLAMGVILVYGFTQGDFSGEGAVLLSMPWGRVSLVDLYVGFVLFSGWIAFRERSPLRSGIWIVFVMILGFFAASLYAFLALQASGGDWRRFWMGSRAEAG
jgi:hypothetical protein